MKQLLFIVLLAMASQASAQTTASSPVPQNGYVPDAATAVAIAQAVLRPIYSGLGKKPQKEDLKATLENDSVWVVRSSRYSNGGPYAEISKANGQIWVAEVSK